MNIFSKSQLIKIFFSVTLFCVPGEAAMNNGRRYSVQELSSIQSLFTIPAYARKAPYYPPVRSITAKDTQKYDSKYVLAVFALIENFNKALQPQKRGFTVAEGVCIYNDGLRAANENGLTMFDNETEEEKKSSYNERFKKAIEREKVAVALAPKKRTPIGINICGHSQNFENALTMITSINLSPNCILSKETPEILAAHFPNLISIVIENCSTISDDKIKRIAELYPNLKYIKFHNCPRITANGLFHLVSNCREIKIDYFNNDFSSQEAIGVFQFFDEHPESAASSIQLKESFEVQCKEFRVSSELEERIPQDQIRAIHLR